MLRQMDNPMVLSQINEAMNNPDFLRMMRESPMVRDNPAMRDFIGTPAFRSMMTNPDMLRAQIRMQQAMAGGQQNAFPAPGVTDTTPQGAASTTQGQQGQQGQQTQNQRPPNPFAGTGMGMGMNPWLTGGMGAGNPFGGGNPFAQLFPQQNQNQNQPSGTNPTSSSTAAATDSQNPTAQAATSNTPQDSGATQEGQNDQQQQQPNPFGNLFGAAGAQGGASPFNNIAQQMMRNPEAMQQMQSLMQTLYGQGQGEGGGSGGPGAGANPFAGLAGLGGLGGFGGLGGAESQQPQQDTRPPEEQYADQLRQLNEMGFYEFERNVRALRMAGGSVQGAVEMLLGGTV